MNEMKRYVVCALVCHRGAAALPRLPMPNRPSTAPGSTDLSQTKFSPKPLSFYISQGWYHCVSSCNPAYDVAADGQDHAVAGHSYDTISVTIVDPHTISVVGKKDGKAMFEQTRTVSADGKTLTVKSTGHPDERRRSRQPLKRRPSAAASRPPACTQLQATGSSRSRAGATMRC